MKSLQISNKAADSLILNGEIKVNQVCIKENIIVNIFDEVTFEQQLIYPTSKPLFYKLYKPVGVECTMNPAIEHNLKAFLPDNEPLFHIGRLDKASEGLLILTNIGQIHDPLLRRSSTPVWKKYYVAVDKNIQEDWLVQMQSGVTIMGQLTLPCKIEPISANTFYIWLNQGLNRQIRRMCQLFGLTVTQLLRLEIGGIQLGNMQSAELLPLNNLEVNYLRQLVNERKNEFN